MKYFSYIIFTIFFTGAVCCKKDKRSSSKASSTEGPKANVQPKKSTAEQFKHFTKAKLAVGEEVEVFEDGCKVNYSSISTNSLGNIPPHFKPNQKQIIQAICSNANPHIKCTQLTADFVLDGKMNGDDAAISVTVNVGCMEKQDDRFRVSMANTIHVYLLLIVILLALIICFFIHSCLKKNKMPFLPQPIGVDSHQQLEIRPSNASVITMDRSTSTPYETSSNTTVQYSAIASGHGRKFSVNKSTSTDPHSRDSSPQAGGRPRTLSVDKATTTQALARRSTATQRGNRKSSINKSTTTEEGGEEGGEEGVEEGVCYLRSDSVNKATSTEDESSKDSLKVGCMDDIDN